MLTRKLLSGTLLDVTLLIAPAIFHTSGNFTGYTLNPPLLSAAACTPKPNAQTPRASIPMEELTWTWIWNTTSCAWMEVSTIGGLVAIDTQGKWLSYSEVKSLHEELIGKELFSNPAKGEYVTFDITGTGNPLKISWPKPGTGIGWLVLDRDGDGVIKDGTQVFGSHIPHSNGDFLDEFWNGQGFDKHPQPCRKPEIEANRKKGNLKGDVSELPCNNNGFIALNYYETQAFTEAMQSGARSWHSNGIIDQSIPVWPQLRVWIDLHCYKTPDVPCQSEPSELHRLEEYNIHGISYATDYLQEKDTIGNRYRWYAPLNPEPVPHTSPKPSKDERLAFEFYPTAVADTWPAGLMPHN